LRLITSIIILINNSKIPAIIIYRPSLLSWLDLIPIATKIFPSIRKINGAKFFIRCNHLAIYYYGYSDLTFSWWSIAFRQLAFGFYKILIILRPKASPKPTRVLFYLAVWRFSRINFIPLCAHHKIYYKINNTDSHCYKSSVDDICFTAIVSSLTVNKN